MIVFPFYIITIQPTAKQLKEYERHQRLMLDLDKSLFKISPIKMSNTHHTYSNVTSIRGIMGSSDAIKLGKNPGRLSSFRGESVPNSSKPFPKRPRPIESDDDCEEKQGKRAVTFTEGPGKRPYDNHIADPTANSNVMSQAPVSIMKRLRKCFVSYSC